MSEGWQRFYRVVRRIPRGRVTTYGAVAAFAGLPRHARHVGYALAALAAGADKVPWHRVLGSRPGGRAAVTIRDPAASDLQRRLLEAEGVAFDEKGHVELDRFGWIRRTRPRRRSAR